VNRHADRYQSNGSQHQRYRIECFIFHPSSPFDNCRNMSVYRFTGFTGTTAPFSLHYQALHLPTRIVDRFPMSPKTFNSHKITTITTTTFKILFMVDCIGM
jgi:hypothetical protein